MIQKVNKTMKEILKKIQPYINEIYARLKFSKNITEAFIHENNLLNFDPEPLGWTFKRAYIQYGILEVLYVKDDYGRIEVEIDIYNSLSINYVKIYPKLKKIDLIKRNFPPSSRSINSQKDIEKYIQDINKN